MEGARIARRAKKRLTPEDKEENPQPMPPFGIGQGKEPAIVIFDPKDRREVDLEELLGDGASALVVEPPSAAVGEHAPAQLSGSKILNAPQIAQHLGRGGSSFFAAPSGSTIERTAPSFGFDNGETEFVAPPFFARKVGLSLGGGVFEEKAVGHVFTAFRREVLLAKTFRPADGCENGPDEIVLGLAFVGQLADWKPGEDFTKANRESIKLSVHNGGPVRKSCNRFGQKIA